MNETNERAARSAAPDRGAFAAVPWSLITHLPQISPAALKTIVYLAARSDYKTGRISRSLGQIGRRIGITTRKYVSAALAELVELGAIDIEQAPTVANSGKGVFRILYPFVEVEDDSVSSGAKVTSGVLNSVAGVTINTPNSGADDTSASANRGAASGAGATGIVTFAPGAYKELSEKEISESARAAVEDGKKPQTGSPATPPTAALADAFAALADAFAARGLVDEHGQMADDDVFGPDDPAGRGPRPPRKRSQPTMTTVEASVFKAVLNAMDGWAKRPKADGGRGPLGAINTTLDKDVDAIRDLAAVITASPLIEWEGQKRPAIELLPLAVMDLMSAKKPFKDTKWAVGCVKNQFRDLIAGHFKPAADKANTRRLGQRPPKPVVYGGIMP